MRRPLTPETLAEVLEVSEGNLAAGKAAEVRGAMAGLVRMEPRSAGAHRLLGLSCQLLGDLDEAEVALRTAVLLQKRDPRHHTDLGVLYAAKGRMKEAERALRVALTLNRLYEPAAAALSRLLVRLERPSEALQATNPLVAGAKASEGVLTAHGQALRALGRDEEALAFLERAVSVAPDDARGHYRLAGVLNELGRNKEAEAALLASIDKGHDTAEAHLALAHVRQDQGQFDEAEAAYKAALERRADHLQVHNDLAELVWMRTGDRKAALATLDASIAARPQDWHLLFAKARALSHAGDPLGAYEAIEAALAQYPAGPILLTTAARAAWTIGKTEQAVARAEQAIALQPDDRGAQAVLAQAYLAAGQVDRAAEVVERLVAGSPDDQFALSLQAVVWRLKGDPRYGELYDYDGLVRVTELGTPKGWKNLTAYLSDLREALTRMHSLKAHPFGQSVRGGTQVVLRHSGDPTVRALHEALAEPITQVVSQLGRGSDPVRRRNTGGWRINGLWSVRLASAGYHDDHVHPGGWLSSACHIDLPDVADETTKSGWLKFGEPGRLVTKPPLEPEHFVQPQPGRLVLFPSYMWHGTVPFESRTPRLSVAFDLVPGTAA